MENAGYTTPDTHRSGEILGNFGEFGEEKIVEIGNSGKPGEIFKSSMFGHRGHPHWWVLVVLGVMNAKRLCKRRPTVQQCCYISMALWVTGIKSIRVRVSGKGGHSKEPSHKDQEQGLVTAACKGAR